MTAAPSPAAPAWGPVEDRVLAAVILAAGGSLSPAARAALTDPTLPSLGTNDELRLISALSGPLGLAALDPTAVGAAADRRALRARALLLGLRLGGASAHASAAVAAALGATPGELLGLQLHLGVAIGQRPLPLGPPLVAALAELLQPPAWLDGVIDGLGGPLAGATPPLRRRAGAISPKRYRHPLDAAATAALGRSVAFEEVARRLSEGVPERVFRLENNASRLRVGPDQLPRLYETYVRCAGRMGVDPVPPLYVAPGPLNAWTAGVEQPFVVLHEGAVSGLSEPELEFIIGHELGHILHQHMLYMMVATLLKIPGSVIGSIPVVGPLLTRGVDLALFEWMRKAELSCDRAGLLCCQDPEVALRMMMRLAGLPGSLAQVANPRAFLAQHDALAGQLDELSSRLFYLLSTAGRSHPWVVVRAHELQRWVDEGHYAALLAEAPDEQGPAAPTPCCPACGAPTSPVDHFCAACGAPLR